MTLETLITTAALAITITLIFAMDFKRVLKIKPNHPKNGRRKRRRHHRLF